MQRPRGHSNARHCALAMLAAGMLFDTDAPFSFGSPHNFAAIAPASAAVAADGEFTTTQSITLSSHVPDEAGAPTFGREAEQFDSLRRDELVNRACEILTDRGAAPVALVGGVSEADIGLREPSHNRHADIGLYKNLADIEFDVPSHGKLAARGSSAETVDVESELIEQMPPRVEVIDDYEYCQFNDWTWQWLPTGLIYRSYMAGVHEPRAAIVAFHEGENRTLWDATLGGRFGIFRCGDCDPLRPQGWQVDFYGAAIARLDVEHQQDLDSTDYVFGVPLTYGADEWQFKFGYAHLSSHLGDELALRDPAALDDRRNYVRDAIVLGTSCYLNPVWRQYGEVGWAFHHSDGAQPWEAQLGTELSRPGPGASPFFAVNGRMREEHDFGGDVTVQAGWLRRGGFGQTMRLGAHYYNGKSSQFQFFDQAEEQIGLGLWYDF